MDIHPAILDLPRTELSAEDHDAYATIIDDILADYGEEAISSDDILGMLRERTSLALTQQRHHIKVLIIERLQMQPAPQTVTLSTADGLSNAPGKSSVAAAVFNIPELMEAILLHLPMRDLAATRRVNKALHRLIETSLSLQRKLFLLPNKEPPEYWGWVCTNDVSEFVTSPGSPPSPPAFLPLYEPEVTARLNPLLEPDDGRRLCSPDGTCVIETVRAARIDQRILNSKVWPEMYLSSPPCTYVNIHFTYAEGKSYPRLQVSRRLYDPAGVTLATIWHGLHKVGDVRVFGGYEPVLISSYQKQRGLVAIGDYLNVERTTVREQIDHHRRRGIKLELEEANDAVVLSRIAVLRSQTKYEGASRPALPPGRTHYGFEYIIVPPS